MARATTGLSYLVFGIVVLSSLVFVIFMVAPQWGVYQESNKAHAQALTKEKERKDFLDNLDRRAQELEKYSTEAAALSVAMPEKIDQSALWVNIQNLAGVAGVTIESIGEPKKSVEVRQVTADEIAEDNVVDTTSKKGSLDKWDTEIAVIGNYSQIRTFVKSLEDSFLLSDMQSLRMTPRGEESAVADVLSVKMNIRTYVQSLGK